MDLKELEIFIRRIVSDAIKKEFEADRKVRENELTHTVVDIKGLIKIFPFLSKSTIYKLVRSQDIPHYKRDGKTVFDPIEINGWFKSFPQITNEELTAIVVKEWFIKKHKRR